VGEWEGNVGVDLSFHNEDDITGETGYFEKAWFRPIPRQENGKQQLEGVTYQMTAWRHGEDPVPRRGRLPAVGKGHRPVMRAVVFGRGIAVLAGGDAKPRDKVLHFKATPGSPSYGLVQNKYLLERAEIKDFVSTFTFHDDGTFSYTSDLLLKLAATGGEMHHTDRNTLHRVKSYHPGAEKA